MWSLKNYWPHYGETKNALLHAITPIFRLRSWLSAKKVASWGVVLKISTSRPLNIVPIGSVFVLKLSLFYSSLFPRFFLFGFIKWKRHLILQCFQPNFDFYAWNGCELIKQLLKWVNFNISMHLSAIFLYFDSFC